LRLPPLPSPRDLLRVYGIRARKQLSQNFLLNAKCLDRLAREAANTGKLWKARTSPSDASSGQNMARRERLPSLLGCMVVEVGPGPGGVTRALLANGAREVHVIEKDRRFLPSLRLLQEATENRLHVNVGDVLNYNMSRKQK